MFNDASNKRLSAVEDASRRLSQATKGNRRKSVTFSPNLTVHTFYHLPTLVDHSSDERKSGRSPSRVASPRSSSCHRHNHSLPTSVIPLLSPAKAELPNGKLKKRRHSVATVSPVEGSQTSLVPPPVLKRFSSPTIYRSQPTAHSTPAASPFIAPAGEPEREARSQRRKSSDRSHRHSSSRRHSSPGPRSSRVYERVEIPSSPTQIAWRSFFALPPNLPTPTTYGPIYADNANLPVYPPVVYDERAKSLHRERGRSPSQKRLSSSSRQSHVHGNDENDRDAPARGRRTQPKRIYASRAPVMEFRRTSAAEYIYAYQEVKHTSQPVLPHWSPDIGAHQGIHTPLQVAPATFGSPTLTHQPLHSPSTLHPLYNVGIAPNNKGAGVFAANDLQPGEIVLREHPFLIVQYDFGTDPRDVYKRVIRDIKPGMLERAEQLVRWAHPQRMGGKDLASVLSSHGVGITLRNYATSDVDAHLALFPTMSLVNHSCGPNALFSCDGESYTLSLVVVRPVRAGEEISVCYAGVLIGSPARIRHQSLWTTYHFRCACTHCCNGHAVVRGDNVRRELGSFWVSGEQMGSRKETVPRMDDWLRDARIDEGALIQRHLRAVQLIEMEGLEAADDTAFEGVVDDTGNGPLPDSFAVQGSPHLHELSHMPRELTHHVDALAACYAALADEKNFVMWAQRGIQARHVALAAMEMGGSFLYDGVYQESKIRREVEKIEKWVRHPRCYPGWGSRAMVSAAAQERLGTPVVSYGRGSSRRR